MEKQVAEAPDGNNATAYEYEFYAGTNNVSKKTCYASANYSDPSNPDNLLFISIPGTADIAVKGNVLYADNHLDLISIDVNSFDEISVIDRKENIFPNKGQDFPDNYEGYFECADPAKGPVIGWEEAILVDPRCKI